MKVKALSRCFQAGEDPSRGLLRDCEIFANLRLQLYFVLGCEEPIQEQFVRSRGRGRGGGVMDWRKLLRKIRISSSHIVTVEVLSRQGWLGARAI